MARIFYGGGIASIKGSIGGWTFQDNISGNIVRNKPIQRQNSTPKQTVVHNDLLNSINLWQALTLLQQTAWNTYASANDKVNQWGSSVTLTGFNWFYMLNYNRCLLGLGYLTAPPAYTLPGSLPVYALRLSGNTIVIEYQSGVTAANTGMFIYASAPTVNTSTPFRSSLRFIKYSFLDPPESVDITSDWETAHSLTYPSATTPYQFKIQVLLVPVHNTTAIDGAGTKLIDEIANTGGGIGSMIIESSFIIG